MYVKEKYNDKNIYLIALLLKTLAYTMHHAFLTIIFLNKGMSFSQVAIIQSMYSLAMVIFEFPSGILSDIFSRKKVYILSNLSLVLVYILIYLSYNFYMLCITWFIYGIAGAFETGTIESEIIITIKESHEKSKLSKFLGKRNRISSIGSLLGSGVGFYLYKLIGIDVYIIAIILILLTTLIIGLFYDGLEDYCKSHKDKFSNILKNLFSDLKNDLVLKKLILILGILQIFVQIHFQLWQSLFINLGIEESNFYFIHLAFQLISFIVYKYNVSKLSNKLICFLVFTNLIIAGAMYKINNALISMVCYFLLISILTLFSFKAEYEIQSVAKNERISSTISLVSTIVRIFGFVGLLVSSKLIEYYSVGILFTIIPVFSISIAGALLMQIKKTNKNQLS